jgi:hypothetical protein
MTHANALSAADYGLVNGGIMEFQMNPDPPPPPGRRMLQPAPKAAVVVAGTCTGAPAINGLVIEIFSAS